MTEQPLNPSPRPLPERRSYPFTRSAAVDSNVLSQEFSVALGRTVEVNYLTPGQEGIKPVLWITDKEGNDVEVDPAEVERLLAAHVPPPPPETPIQRRARLNARADAATSVAALRAVVKELIDRA